MPSPPEVIAFLQSIGLTDADALAVSATTQESWEQGLTAFNAEATSPVGTLTNLRHELELLRVRVLARGSGFYAREARRLSAQILVYQSTAGSTPRGPTAQPAAHQATPAHQPKRHSTLRAQPKCTLLGSEQLLRERWLRRLSDIRDRARQYLDLPVVILLDAILLDCKRCDACHG